MGFGLSRHLSLERLVGAILLKDGGDGDKLGAAVSDDDGARDVGICPPISCIFHSLVKENLKEWVKNSHSCINSLLRVPPST